MSFRLFPLMDSTLGARRSADYAWCKGMHRSPRGHHAIVPNMPAALSEQHASRQCRTMTREPSARPSERPIGGLHKLDEFHDRWRSISGLIVLSSVAGMVAGLLLGYFASDLPMAKQPDLPSMSQCISETLNLLSQNTPARAEILRDARDHCYSSIQAQGLINDFGYRKIMFLQQYRANGVLMWMVVIVTLSGVLLAGLQLWASYKLAAANKTSLHHDQGELSLQRDRLVLKSSITGLFILLISFCFFLVFVFYVYRLEAAPDVNGLARRPVITSPMDGLGPPPQGSKDR